LRVAGLLGVPSAPLIPDVGRLEMEDDQLTAANGAAESSLHAAAWSGDIEEVRALVEAGADVNWRDSIGESAIFGAAGWGNAEVVRYLLGKGARHDFREHQSGYTALHWAARSKVEVAKILVEARADVSVTDNFGRLPVDWAHENGKGDVVRYLKTVRPEIATRRGPKGGGKRKA